MTLDLSYLGSFSSSVLHIPHNSFLYQKSWWKVQVNMVNVVTPQELKIVCGKSNATNVEKKLFCVRPLLIRPEKIVHLSGESKKV